MKTRHDILKEIKEHPERHRHKDLNELTNCCMTNGAIDLSIMDAHQGLTQTGGPRCDVDEGPCACGGWH